MQVQGGLGDAPADGLEAERGCPKIHTLHEMGSGGISQQLHPIPSHPAEGTHVPLATTPHPIPPIPVPVPLCSRKHSHTERRHRPCWLP